MFDFFTIASHNFLDFILQFLGLNFKQILGENFAKKCQKLNLQFIHLNKILPLIVI